MYHPEDDQRHRDLMRAHYERQELEVPVPNKDRCPSDAPLHYQDGEGREAKVALRVPGLGYVIVSCREHPEDPSGKLDWLQCAIYTDEDVRWISR